MSIGPGLDYIDIFLSKVFAILKFLKHLGRIFSFLDKYSQSLLISIDFMNYNSSFVKGFLADFQSDHDTS